MTWVKVCGLSPARGGGRPRRMREQMRSASCPSLVPPAISTWMI